MKSKGAIKFFAIALTLVCLFQLSFTLVSYIEDQKAENYANGDKEKERAYLDSIAYQEVYNLGIRQYTYLECKERSLNLGLDLRGGMHVTLEVSLSSLVNRLANNPSDSTFVQALRNAERDRGEAEDGFISLFYEKLTELDPDVKLSNYFATSDNQDHVTFQSSNQNVMEFLQEQAESGLDNTYNILQTRIDRFGVTQPNIQLQENTGRIVIELPGADNPERVRKLLQGTANLEFWETYKNQEFSQYLVAANDALADELEITGDTTQTEAGERMDDYFDQQEEPDTGLEARADTIAAPDDTGDIAAVDTDNLLSALGREDTAGDDTSEQLSEAEMRQQNPLFALLYPNITQNDEGAFANEGPVIGYARGADTVKINEMLNSDAAREVLPPDVVFFWEVKALPESDNSFVLIAGRAAPGTGGAVLDGKVITDAGVDIDQAGSRQIRMVMNSEGAAEWKRVTAANIGNEVAIVLDNKAYSYPTVQGEIPNGISTITGGFSAQESEDLANILKSGKLPISVNIIEEAIVGPSLGEASINQGMLSLLVGLLLVLIFMGFYYHKSGLVANFTLVANLFFILGVLSSLGAALTLPGMAGIVLTIGMSVDANVLIFERIREELRAGKGMRLAVADGYKNAYSSIIDGNLTTLLTGIILLTFGTGPIYGFATVLVIGILTSFFSAVFISRLIFDWMLDKETVMKFGTKATLHVMENPNLNILEKSRVAYMVSGVVILLGLISMFTRGFDFGVDFSGGYSYIVEFEEPQQTEEIRSMLEPHFGGAPEVKTFGSSRDFKITTSYLINEDAEGTAARVESSLQSGLEQLNGGYEVLRSEKVGPTIASDIKTSAFWSVLFSLLVIFLYIFFRFRRWQYGLGAVVAVTHDVLLILGLFSLLHNIVPFSLEVDQAFIAAILTVVGYSINDTVIVFDRIRENLGLHKRTPLTENMNNALNATLSRTMITSGTTFLVVLVLFLFGGEIIRGFSFALLIGILVGTYSSLFIATPVAAKFHRIQMEAEKQNKMAQ
ncbi:MAG: protein translocase subunit SecDF [Bacteroidia bacterium]